MTYKVFISYNSNYINLVNILAQNIRNFGAEPYIAEYDPQAGKLLAGKLTNKIAEADCFLVLLTPNSSRSPAVNNEIGIAKGKGKYILPIVESGAEIPLVLKGIEYIPLDLKNLMNNTINKTEQIITRLIDQKNNTQNILILSAIVAFALFLISRM